MQYFSENLIFQKGFEGSYGGSLQVFQEAVPRISREEKVVFVGGASLVMFESCGA